MMLNFFEWVKKMGGAAGGPYDPKVDVKKGGAGGWWGDPKSMIKPKKNEARNHMGEVEYNSWGAWMKAMKKLWPNIILDGDKDIAQAFSNAPGSPPTPCGEWDGVVGTVVIPGVFKEFPSRGAGKYVNPHTGGDVPGIMG